MSCRSNNHSQKSWDPEHSGWAAIAEKKRENQQCLALGRLIKWEMRRVCFPGQTICSPPHKLERSLYRGTFISSSWALQIWSHCSTPVFNVIWKEIKLYGKKLSDHLQKSSTGYNPGRRQSRNIKDQPQIQRLQWNCVAADVTPSLTDWTKFNSAPTHPAQPWLPSPALMKACPWFEPSNN